MRRFVERIDYDLGEASSEDEGNHYLGPANKRGVRDVPIPTHVEEATMYGSRVRLNKARQYMPLEPYTAIEMMQLRSVNLHVPRVPSYRLA